MRDMNFVCKTGRPFKDPLEEGEWTKTHLFNWVSPLKYTPMWWEIL